MANDSAGAKFRAAVAAIERAVASVEAGANDTGPDDRVFVPLEERK